MKNNKQKDMWNDLNIVSKGLLYIGGFIIDIGFKLSGFKQK